jgi:hypothetical protein
MAQTFLLRKRDDKNHYKISSSKKLHYCVVLIFLFFNGRIDVKCSNMVAYYHIQNQVVCLLKEGGMAVCVITSLNGKQFFLSTSIFS